MKYSKNQYWPYSNPFSPIGNSGYSQKKEQEFKDIVSEKDSEIGNIKKCLMVTKKEIQRIKARTFWQKLKVCFQHE
jgi:hypothetical protein